MFPLCAPSCPRPGFLVPIGRSSRFRSNRVFWCTGGQLLATVGLLGEDETGHSLWEVEDTEFATALDRFVADLARRGMDAGEPNAAGELGRSATGDDDEPPPHPKTFGTVEDYFHALR